MTMQDFCRRAVGVPYRERGESFSGWDCWGLLRLFFWTCLGMELTDYRQEPLPDRLDKALAHWRLIPIEQADLGDALLFRGDPCHVGVIVKRDKMLHVLKGRNTTIESYLTPWWKYQLLGVYRHV